MREPRLNAFRSSRQTEFSTDEREVPEYVPSHFKIIVHAGPKMSRCYHLVTMRGGDEALWLARLDDAYASIEATVEQSLTEGETDIALIISSGLEPYCPHRSTLLRQVVE
jgi:hypothetical protein